MSPRLAAIVSAALLFSCGGAPAPAQAVPPDAKGPVVEMEPLEVTADREEVGSWPEEKPGLFPFGGGGVFGDFEGEKMPDLAASAVKDELNALTELRPVEFASVSGAGTPRGFTAPRLRNGITQLGFPEQIVGGRRDLLTGFMAVLYGRTAPGGILNLISRRPTPQASGGFEVLASSRPALYVQGERAAPLVPKKLHGRLFGSFGWQEGPEAFARRDEEIGAVSLRHAPDRRTTVLVELEYAVTTATPSPGMLLHRTVPGARIGGPWLPLAGFNPDGPAARSRRRSLSTSVWAERGLGADRFLRAGVQWWRRGQEELRFATGPFVVSTGRFDGVREPQFNERAEHTLGAQIEADVAVRGRRVNQRWLAGLEGSRAAGDRGKRALPRAVRDALPSAVRFLDPTAPDFSLTPYSPETYSRVLTLRDETADYLGAFLSDRLSWARGRYGASLGLRQDWVKATVDDRLPTAPVPRAATSVRQTTYHGGLVVQFARGLSGFLNHSTAFQPQRRVDARTGRIQGNESTRGVEAGLRWQTPSKRMLATAAVYRLWNQDITRLNPAYEDPVLDPDRTQPQLVSSGEEQFTGAEGSLRWVAAPSVTLDVRGAWLEAVTTASPDLPEEVGRQLPRTPKVTGSATVGWAPGGSGRGPSLGAGWAWIGPHTAVYPGRTREAVSYGGYGVLVANAGFGWTRKRTRLGVALVLRNALDRDLVAAAARLGGERTLEGRFNARF